MTAFPPIRLYQAPVESDVQSKPLAEKSSAQARSSIRRSIPPSVSRHDAARDRRRRALIAHVGALDSPRRQSPSQDSFESPAAYGQNPASDNNAESLRPPIRRARLAVDDRFAVVLAGDDSLWRYAVPARYIGKTARAPPAGLDRAGHLYPTCASCGATSSIQRPSRGLLPPAGKLVSQEARTAGLLRTRRISNHVEFGEANELVGVGRPCEPRSAGTIEAGDRSGSGRTPARGG